MDMICYLRAMLDTCLARANSEEGQGMVEYALILSVVAVAAVVVLGVLNNNLHNAFNSVAGAL